MKASKNKLYIKDWMKIQPYSMASYEDMYYLQLANKMLDMANESMKDSFSMQTKRTIALSVSAYFQDVISGLGLWQGFTNKHFDLYGKYLPFYDLTEDYIPEEINLEDVCFIIWNIAGLEAKEERGTIINPENPGIQMLGLRLYKVILDEYETAPESEVLKNLLTEGVDYDDFYAFREILDWLYYDSYLISPYTAGVWDEIQEDLKKEEKKGKFEKSQLEHFMYSFRYAKAMNTPCGPLALRTYEWLVAAVGKHTELGKMLLRIQLRFDMGTYLIEGEEKNSYTLLAANDGERIKLIKDSVRTPLHLISGHKAAVCNLILYKGEWNLCCSLVKIDEEIFGEQRKEAEEKKLNMEHTKELFLKTNDNKMLHFSKDNEELRAFMKKMFKKTDESVFNKLEEHNNWISYIDEKKGFFSQPDFAVFIKDKNNPYYDKKITKEYGMAIFDCDLPGEIIEYLIKNNLLPDVRMNSLQGEKRGKELVLQNMDFLFRFFQPQSFG